MPKPPAVNAASTLAVALAAMLWGSDLLLRPGVLAAGWSPARVVWIEHLLLTLVFLPILWRTRRQFGQLTRRQWGALLFVAWGGSALATVLYTEAFSLDYTRALTVVLLQKTQPLFALTLAAIVLGERRRGLFWGWCALAVAGAVLLVVCDKQFEAHLLVGVQSQQAFCAVGAAALWGAATVAGRMLLPTLTSATLTGARFALALVPLTILAALSPPGHAGPNAAQSGGWLFLGLIVLLPDLIGMALYYRGLRGTTASAATLAELCYPLTSLLIGLTVQHAKLTPGQWIGFGLLTGAVAALGLAPGVIPSQEKTRDIQPAAVS